MLPGDRVPIRAPLFNPNRVPRSLVNAVSPTVPDVTCSTNSRILRGYGSTTKHISGTRLGDEAVLAPGQARVRRL